MNGAATKRFFLISIILISLFFGHMVTLVTRVNADSLEGFSYRQELSLPLDTSQPGALFQPIDIRVEFRYPCWARNETHHSIRVGANDGSGLEEIDSQIYDLDYNDESHISACSLVFLIPGTATGKEKYYVIYDEEETPLVIYPDHVHVEDTHYFFEPISGQKIDFDYYKIIQDDYVTYGICQKGVLLGNGVANFVIKMNSNSTEFETMNADQMGMFSLYYSSDGSQENRGSAWAHNVLKEILVDGNLMTRVCISALSPEETVKTDNIYTYYYTPAPFSTQRLIITQHHSVLETVDITGDQEEDPMYSGLLTFKARSATIDKMNTGEILPLLHFYSEDDIPLEYSMSLDPTTPVHDWFLSTTDDMDLGSHAWISVDDPHTGNAHGLIFDKHVGYAPGELDGLQVKASTKQYVKLPGLEADAGQVIITRNSYERGGEHHTVITPGIQICFQTDFFTTETGGYEAVDQESIFFQQLSPLRPVFPVNLSEEEKEDRYSLTVFVHGGHSFPLGSVLSAVLGKNFSYLTAELYRDNQLSSSGSIGRFPLSETTDFNFENTTLIEKIQMALGFFDWRNQSLFKKIMFPSIAPGTYILKIYRENPAIWGDRHYIGFHTLNFTRDTTIHVPLVPEGIVTLSTLNQEGQGLDNVIFSLYSDTATIATTITDSNGSAILTAPRYPLHSYTLRVLYHGFLIDEKTIHLALRHNVAPPLEEYVLDVYPFGLRLVDTWGFPPVVEVNPVLTSAAMSMSQSLYGDRVTPGEYVFRDLLPGIYTLKMGYKSVVVKETITIPGDGTRKIVFPAEFPLQIAALNSHGYPLSGGTLTVTRGGDKREVSLGDSGKAEIMLPPGDYDLVIYGDDEGDEEIAHQMVTLRSDKNLDLVTTQGSLLHTLFFYLGIILILLSLVYMAWKRRFNFALRFIIIGILLISLVVPWWTLQGDEGDVSTTTQTYLIPPKLITHTSTSIVSGGEVSTVPDEAFTLALGMLTYLLIGVCLLLFLGVFVKTYKRLIVIFRLLGIILLLLTVIIFYYAMDQLTGATVGSFRGSDALETTLPGLQESVFLSSTWGPSLGFYLVILVVILLSIYTLFFKKIHQALREKQTLFCKDF